jgi:hypothetical protein
MIENESSAPQLLAALIAGGLATLLIGVEVGIQGSPLGEPLQAVGGAIIVAGILGLAYHLEQLPDKFADH